MSQINCSRYLSMLPLLVAGMCVPTDRAATAPTRSPVLIELFTSEGCSSCPPADTFIQRLDASQPVPGAQLIVLSEHVDYWNHDGWKDPYSSSSLTERQGAYAHALALKDVYTPQIFVDGTTELKLRDSNQVGEILEKAATAPMLPVRIESAKIDGTNPALVRGHIQIDNTSDVHNGDVYVAVALNHAESDVLRGENKGRRLTHVAVVESLKKIGKLEKNKSFGEDFQMKLKPGTDPANIRIVAFVQEPGPGKVLGAAVEKAPFE